MDTREGSMCTTVHSVYTGETVLRLQTAGDGHSQRVPLARPTAVDGYNKYMGGVDTSNQMLGTNSVHRRTRRCPMTVFQHLVAMAATNSYMLPKKSARHSRGSP
ncbi:piggyBac transposable element-derived protein 4-like [Xyrichtys novacula]|uniref:PiggyBac transposable element-derived protein 4-like n=1 Tax=Xyrichtys novacula TaxID=13765 RepID=A0AAV1GGY4_XYRNO|nr:piggyBac transposable element-derived protein 4-like [Xyrichtys novacula]